MRSNDSLKVIVVGIPKTLDDAALSEIFAPYGSVADAKVVLDVNTNASRGFGFVTFTAQSAMRRAIKEMDKKQLEGRTLNVRQLVPKDKFTKEDGKSAGVSDLAKRPCYLLRKGKCNKGDRCPFSHEIKSGEFGSCFEFVQNGFCKRGDNCKFFHPPPPEDQDEDAEAATTAPTPAAKDSKKTEKAEKKVEPKTEKKAKTESKSVEEPKKEKKEPKEPREVKKPKDDKPRYCFAYQTGRCHRGKRCLFLHEKLDVPEQQAPPAPVQKKRPSDFEVVTTEEPSKKRRRESDEETETEDEDDDEDGEPAAKAPVVKAPKAKAAEKVLEKKTAKAPKAEEKKDENATGVESKDETPALDPNGKPIHTGPKPICRHFMKGRCKRGHICFFRHERPPVEAVVEEEVVEEEEDETPLQAVADHVASFMANFSSNSAPFVPSATPVAPASPVKPVVKVVKPIEVEVAKSSPGKAPKRKAEEIEETVKDDESPSDGAVPEEDNEGEESEPLVKKARTHFKKEKVDMGAAFDGVDSDDEPRKGGRRVPRQKVTKEQMKANREKLREERRAKRTSKKQARERLRTDGEIDLEA